MEFQKSLFQRYHLIRQRTTELVKPLQIEDFGAQPIIDVSPPKWHLGHSTWFFENFILKDFAPDYKLFDSRFAYIFNSYYVSQGERLQRDKRSSLIRPSTEEIFAYRDYVDLAMERFLNSTELGDEALNFLEIGLNHEQQHQELLITDIKYIFSSNALFPAYQKEESEIKTSLKEIAWLDVKEGVYEIGYAGDGFCFDNELGRHKVYLNAFQLADRLVSNGEYLEFIKDGGYQNPSLWLSEGWDWLQTNGVKYPEYWFEESGEFKSFSLQGIQPIKLEETLTHVSFYEADAYARWAEKRLLTEFEWEIAANQYGEDTAVNHFQEKKLFHPGSSQNNQLFGTAWEWTNSAYLAYPNYQQKEGALGEYNGKFMINQMVLRGGSCASPKSHIRSTYRNFFHPHLRWQFTGIRLASK